MCEVGAASGTAGELDAAVLDAGVATGVSGGLGASPLSERAGTGDFAPGWAGIVAAGASRSGNAVRPSAEGNAGRAGLGASGVSGVAWTRSLKIWSVLLAPTAVLATQDGVRAWLTDGSAVASDGCGSAESEDRAPLLVPDLLSSARATIAGNGGAWGAFLGGGGASALGPVFIEGASERWASRETVADLASGSA